MDHKTDTDSERAIFEQWWSDWQSSTWTPRHDRDMPGHWNEDSKERMRLAFQAGRASLAASAGSEPAGYWDGEFSDVGCALLYEVPQISAFGRQYRNVPLYTHPSPPEGMVGGWIKASEQLPPCRDDQDYIGINTAGFAGIFNAVADIAGNVHCMMETAEDSVSIMSDLDIWKPFVRPPIAAGGGKEAG